MTPEVVWTSERLGHAAARNLGLRRAAGAIVVLADGTIEPTGDPLTPLEATLADPGIAVAGAFGLVAADLRRFASAPGPDVDAIELCWLAFRRDDLATLGPLDERLAVEDHLGTWWSLALRAGADDGTPPRAARRLDLPLARHADHGRTSLPAEQRDRLVKRSFYRLLDRFGHRPDLLSGVPATGPSTAAES